MKRDFTIEVYKNLCKSIKESGFVTTRVCEYIKEPSNGVKRAIMRHDVDSNPSNALLVARIEKEHGIRSTFYFRTNSKVFDEKIIKDIYSLGHEIGYHYEVLAKCRGEIGKAMDIFREELKNFRMIVPVETVCMHGSPWSKYRDSDIWKSHSMDEYGIIGEAFLSINYDKVHYCTDTGRSWNNAKYNIRDKVESRLKTMGANSTFELLDLISTIELDICINTHPQRWHGNKTKWFMELISQNLKNYAKRGLSSIGYS